MKSTFKETYAALVAKMISELSLARSLVVNANIIANPHKHVIRSHVEGIAYSANIGATIMVGTMMTTSSANQFDISSIHKTCSSGCSGCSK